MPDSLITIGGLKRAVWKRDHFDIRIAVPDHVMLPKAPSFDPELIIPGDLTVDQYVEHYIIPYLPSLSNGAVLVSSN